MDLGVTNSPFGGAAGSIPDDTASESRPPSPRGESRGHEMAIAVSFLVSVSGLFLALRLYCKFLKRRGLWWDDHVLVAAWLALLGDTIITVISIQTLGFGHHVTDIQPKQNVVTIGLLSNCSGSLAILAAVWSKTSFGMTLLRITGRRTKVVVWAIILSMNLAMSMNVVTTWVQCNPIGKGWDRSLPGRCWDPRVNTYYGIFAGAYSGLMDIVLALLPWSVVWNLQMRKKEKIGIAVAMSMGVFAGGAAFVKCSKIPVILNGDFTFEGHHLVIWGATEVAITIVAASIPVLRVLAREVRVATRRRYGYGAESAAAGSSSLNKSDASRKKKKLAAGTVGVELQVERSNSTIVTVTSGYKRGRSNLGGGSITSLGDLEKGGGGTSEDDEMKRLSDANPDKIVQTQEITVRYFEKDDDDMKKMFDGI